VWTFHYHTVASAAAITIFLRFFEYVAEVPLWRLCVAVHAAKIP
jgi:hypothetical protein